MITENHVLNTRYRLDKKVGQGGFAQVFLATDQLLKRRVAVKVLNQELTEDENFLGRFEREAQSIAALEHPNILGVYDYGQAEGTAYLVMPYVEGGTLHDKLRREKRLSLKEADDYLHQAAAALDYAHKRNIVHRDIKPQNMLLRTDDNRLLLADFGIAKVVSAASAQSRTGVMGTLSYMSPEQLEGNVTLATDVYALGCVLFQMLTGQLPYAGPTEQVMVGHMMKPIPSILDKVEGQLLPPAVQLVIEKALAKKPEQRFATAGELAQAFHTVITGGTFNASGLNNQTLPASSYSQPAGNYDPTQVVRVIAPQSFAGTPPHAYNTTPPPPTGPQYPPPPTITQYPPVGTPPYGVAPIVAKKPNYALWGGLAAILVAAAVAIIVILSLGSSPQPSPTIPTPNAVANNGATTAASVATVATTAPAVTTALPVATTPAATPTPNDPTIAPLKEANETFYAKGDLSAGIDKFRNLSQDYPKNAKVWRDYGNAQRLVTSDADGTGLTSLKLAVQYDDKDPLTFLYLSNTLAQNYQYEEAAKAAQTAAQLDPNGWVGQAALLSQFMVERKYEEASKAFEAMQKAAGGAASDPYYNIIVANYKAFTQDWNAGIEAIDKTLAVWPNLPTALGEKAVLILNSASAREKSEAVRKQNWEKALGLLQQAQKLAPRSSTIHATLAAYYAFFPKDYEQTDKYVQEALKIYEGNAEAQRLAGEVLRNKKDYDGAIKRYKRCVELDKLQKWCQIEWGFSHFEQGVQFNTDKKTNEANGAFKAALEKAQEATRLDSQEHQTYGLAGLAQYFLKDYKSAIASFDKAITIAPNQIWLYVWQGYSYLDDGQRSKAQAAYNNGLEKDVDKNDPDLAALKNRLDAK